MLLTWDIFIWLVLKGLIFLYIRDGVDNGLIEFYSLGTQTLLQRL